MAPVLVVEDASVMRRQGGGGGDSPTPFRDLIDLLVVQGGGGGDGPTPFRESIGKTLRVLRPGDEMTLDYNPDRVNVRVKEDQSIWEVTIG